MDYLESEEYRKMQALHKEQMLNLMDSLDKMNTENVTYLMNLRKLFELKLKQVDECLKDSEAVNVESIALRTEIEVNADMFTQEQKFRNIDKVNGMRQKLNKPTIMFSADY
jgi:hypothetical protein